MVEGILAVGFLVLLPLKFVARFPKFPRYFSLSVLILSLLVLVLQFRIDGPSNEIGTLFVTDSIAYLSKGFLLFLGSIILLFTDEYISFYDLPETETYFLLGMQILGMMICVSCCHWMSLFLGLELMYLPTYAMVALKVQDKVSQESACKYIILGAFFTGVLLYGISFLYASVESLSFHDMQPFVEALQRNIAYGDWLSHDQSQLIFSIGGLLVMVSLCFKLGVVPFHFWVRDVYEGSLYFVTALISSLPKLVLVVIWLRIFSYEIVGSIHLWRTILCLMGVVSLFFGNVLALAQERVRSLLAYASFANMGIVLLALAMGNVLGNIAALTYIFGYVFTILVILLLLGSISVKSRELVLLDDLKGLAYEYPNVAFLASIGLFSLLGVPPLVGFMFKVNLILSLVDSSYLMLAFLVVLGTVLSAYYYINLVCLMYFYKPDDNQCLQVNMSLLQKALLQISFFALIFFGLFPQVIYSIISNCFT